MHLFCKKSKISVEIIKDSYNKEFDSRVTTMLLEYPRIVHSELLTHRCFSRNASSSRAIPVSLVIDQVTNNIAKPVRFGKNKAGMQDAGVYENSADVEKLWEDSSRAVCDIARLMNEKQAHKQVINRILEPYQTIKVCLTSTNWNNWFNLRDHKDADPSLQALASLMKKAMKKSKPVELKPHFWHIPFVEDYCKNNKQYFKIGDKKLTLKQALSISASCCAQTSYRKLDFSLEKALDIYKKLIKSKPCHASPVEHQCIAIEKMPNFLDYFNIKGVTHIDKNKIPWSGNFHGFIQHRQLINNNALYY